jgi:gas vesicle protein
MCDSCNSMMELCNTSAGKHPHLCTQQVYVLKLKIMNSGKVLVGILASLAAGAAIGILFAPEKGTLTRKKISSKKDELEGKIDTLLTGVAEKYDKISGEVKSLAKAGTEKTEQFLKEVAANGNKL